MEIIQIIGIGIVITLIAVFLKGQRPEIAIQISIAGSILVFVLISGKLYGIIELLNKLANKADINTVYISTLFKIMGIAYITEFGAGICRDAGESSMAYQIELAGKVTIAVIAVPIITSLLELIVKIMP